MAKQNKQQSTHPVGRGAAGIALVIVALLLQLSLWSYSPQEVSIIQSPAETCSNWVGPAGLYAAWAIFSLFGAAAQMIPILLAAAGCMALWSLDFTFTRAAIFFSLLTVTASQLLDLPNHFGNPKLFLDAWKHSLLLPYVGGHVGGFLNEFVFVKLLGPVGAAIILSVLYLSALTLFLRIHPVLLVREEIPALIDRFWEWRMARAEAKASAAKQLEIQQLRLQREQRKIEKELRKRGVTPPAPPTLDLDDFDDDSTGDDLPEAPHPAPKIVDTTQALRQSDSDEDDDVSATSPIARATTRSAEDEGDLTPEDEDEPLPPRTSSRRPSAKTPAVSPLQPGIRLFPDYEMPPLDLLAPPTVSPRNTGIEEELQGMEQTLIRLFRDHGVKLEPRETEITRGATVTRFEVYPAPGVRVDRITSLDRDIARVLKVESVNILAPVPGKDSVAVEVPNKSKTPVVLRDIFDHPAWANTKAKIPLALGKDIYGQPVIADLAVMPHLLVAGTTGSGKSVCVNDLLLSMLYRFSPDDLRLILVDPKQVEMTHYNGLPHLVTPVVTDSKKVLAALRWVINEMEKRYEMLSRASVRNITGFNSRPKEKPKTAPDPNDPSSEGDEAPDNTPAVPPAQGMLDLGSQEPLPDKLSYIVVVIDELADLMQTAPKDVEAAIARLAAKARAAGIHLIICTQTPRAQVITGVIKANIPSRIALKVSSGLDSRVILDTGGAENLVGNGDMLFLAPGTSRLVRAQGAYQSDEELMGVLEYIKKKYPAPPVSPELKQGLGSSGGDSEEDDEDYEILAKCFEVLRDQKRKSKNASTSVLQRMIGLGYTRAARVIDIFYSRGFVGDEGGAKGREILIELDEENPYHTDDGEF